MHRLNIVQPEVKSKSRSVIVVGSGQGASWRMCVHVFSLTSLDAFGV